MEIQSQPASELTQFKGRREAARLLEMSFIEEMLKYSGLAETPEEFGGGLGESQFSSLLYREYAEALSGNGGIGLQEALFQALTRSDVKDD